jgi:hypothetical protein
VYRDDEAAREERMAALEREAKRAEQLAERVRELEAENRELRALVAAPPAPEPAATDVYLDPKLEEYIQAIVTATRSPRYAESILSGALPIDAKRIVDRTRELAREVARPYAIPGDVKQAARELLPQRIIARTGSSTAALEEILEHVEVP